MTTHRSPPIETFRELVRLVSPAIDDLYFVQVGANNGRDLLGRLVRTHGWRGILVEPHPDVFEHELLPAYRDHESLAFENVAIAERDGHTDLFVLSFSRARWATGLASLRRSHLVEHIERGYVDRMLRETGERPPESSDDWIARRKVRTMTFETLFDRHRPDKVDLLQIDAEGYDYRLLQLFDFDRYRPLLLLFEVHVMSESERRESRAKLAAYGYVTFLDGVDCVAVQRMVVDSLGLRFEGEATEGSEES